MKYKIYFVEKTIPFNASDFDKPIISGSEKTLINISNELAKNDKFDIKVFNLTNNNQKICNVEWKNINQIYNDNSPDILISMSDAKLLSLFNCKKKFLWSHSVQSLEKFIRKGQFFPFIKNRPTVLLEGNYHYETRSFITSFFGKKIIPIAVDYEFINEKIDINFIPDRNAIFTTRSDRNLNFLIDCWNVIFSKVKHSKLYINPPFQLSENHKNLNIKVRDKGTKLNLIKDLIKCKLMLNPGHKGEVFCLAAEEAKELCIPIVTMGYGSLKERVDHGVTGYIAKNKNEFINYSVKILTNNDEYLNLKNNLIKKRNLRTYMNVAKDLLDIFNGY